MPQFPIPNSEGHRQQEETLHELREKWSDAARAAAAAARKARYARDPVGRTIASYDPQTVDFDEALQI